MIITNLKITKVAKDNPRYPAFDAMKRGDGSHIPFAAVYICECETDEGMKEAAWFSAEDGLSPREAADIVERFAEAISLMGPLPISEYHKAVTPIPLAQFIELYGVPPEGVSIAQWVDTDRAQNRKLAGGLTVDKLKQVAR